MDESGKDDKKKCNLLENLAKDGSEWREYNKGNILDPPLLSVNTQTCFLGQNQFIINTYNNGS